MKLLACNSNLALSEEIATTLNIPLTKASIKKFSDEEIFVEVNENVRGQDVYVIQSTSKPANDNLVELLVCIDALKRASAKQITAVIPYFGYARQDRRVRSSRVPISAKVVANMLESTGANRILTMDLHSDQIQGFFDIPVDNIYATPIMLGEICKNDFHAPIVVSPDVGGVVRARAFAKELNTDLAIIDKRRSRANVSEVMTVLGDVSNRTCLIMDDVVDTAGTLIRAADALKEKGAVAVNAYCTHPVLSGEAVSRIEKSALDQLVVTDTIPLTEEGLKSKKIKQISCGGLLAETILRISKSDSVSSLFLD